MIQSAQNNIVWLASYPKSGNTWFRIFLANLLKGREEPVDINAIGISIASSRELIDQALGICTADLRFDEVEKLRPLAYQQISTEANDIIYFKAHDAYFLPNGKDTLFHSQVSKAAVYFIRNPLDIAVSFAHHNATSIDRIIQRMADDTYTLCDNEDRLINQLPQFLNTWGEHSKGWLNQTDIPILVLRYEDMLLDTMNTFKKALQFLDLKYSDSDILRAIEFSSFDVLKLQEQKQGFYERMAKASSFFRNGRANDYINHLTKSQIDQIIQINFDRMKCFSYI